MRRIWDGPYIYAYLSPDSRSYGSMIHKRSPVFPRMQLKVTRQYKLHERYIGPRFLGRPDTFSTWPSVTRTWITRRDRFKLPIYISKPSSGYNGRRRACRTMMCYQSSVPQRSRAELHLLPRDEGDIERYIPSTPLKSDKIFSPTERARSRRPRSNIRGGLFCATSRTSERFENV